MMKSIKATRGLERFMATAGLLLLFAPTLLLLPQDIHSNGDIPAVVVQANRILDLPGGMKADCFLSVSGLLVDPANGSSCRVLTLATTMHLGQVMLEQNHALHKIAAVEAEPITVLTGQLNTGLAQLLAAEVTGAEDLDALGFLASGETIESHLLTVVPAQGLTWGMVTVPSDIEFSAVRAPEKR